MGAMVMPLLIVGVLIALIQAVRTKSCSNRWRNTGILLLGVFWALGTPAIGHCLLLALENGYAPLQHIPDDCDTIVVLAGSALPSIHEESVGKLGDSTLRRCIEAIRLYRQSGSAVIVSGGRVPGNLPKETLAQLMAAFLVAEGVRSGDIEQESESVSTLENSIATGRMLRTNGLSRIVLVTDAAHMRRAAKCFERRGLRVTPAPCNYQGVWPPDSWRWFSPSPDGLLKTQYACHEFLGAVWYWMIDSG